MCSRPMAATCNSKDNTTARHTYLGRVGFKSAIVTCGSVMIVWRGHSCPRQRSVQNLARELADNGVHPSPSENPCPWNIAGVYPITKRRTGPVTFCRLSKQPFSEEECSLILKRCLQGNGSKF